MKLTKEDILKYGLKEEISSLWGGEIYAYLEHVAEEIMGIEGPHAKHEIFMILKEVYERGGTGR